MSQKFVPGLGLMTSYDDVALPMQKSKPAEMVPGAPTEESGEVGHGVDSDSNINPILRRAPAKSASDLAKATVQNMAPAPTALISAKSKKMMEPESEEEPEDEEVDGEGEEETKAIHEGDLVRAPAHDFVGRVFKAFENPEGGDRTIVVKSWLGEYFDFAESELMPVTKHDALPHTHVDGLINEGEASEVEDFEEKGAEGDGEASDNKDVKTRERKVMGGDADLKDNPSTKKRERRDSAGDDVTDADVT